MKKFLCIGEEYESQGQKKMAWQRIGEIFTAKSGKEYAKIYTIPGKLISIFEDKPKAQAPSAQSEDFGDTTLPF